jgi:hypothetical protein
LWSTFRTRAMSATHSTSLISSLRESTKASGSSTGSNSNARNSKIFPVPSHCLSTLSSTRKEKRSSRSRELLLKNHWRNT